MSPCEVTGVSKAFPGVQALDNVSLTLRTGEIHALIGENGAGKSTLIKIVTGLYQPDAGEIEMFGKPVKFTSTRAAIQAGIGVVPQERNLIPGLHRRRKHPAGEDAGAGGHLCELPGRSTVKRRKWLDVMRLEISPGEWWRT